MDKRLTSAAVVLAVFGAVVAVLWARFSGPTPELTADGGEVAVSADAAKRGRALADRAGAQATSDGGALSAAAGVWAKAGWGSGPGQLGRERREEGNAEGPMSLTLLPNGEAAVLDTANGRIARYKSDGSFKDSIPVPVQFPQEMISLPDGRTLVMDRLVDKSIALLDKDGKPHGELPIIGKTVQEGGTVTGMFVDGDDVLVEVEHGATVKVGNIKGEKHEAQPELPGRPTRDSKAYLTAGITDPAAGKLWVSSFDKATQAQRFTREIRLEPTVRAILLLDSDASGVIYLAVGTIKEKDTEIVDEKVTLLCLDPLDGRPLGQASVPPNTLPEESYRDFAVYEQGGVLYQLRTEEGVQLRKIDCR